jgi:type VI secretion system protein ImpM
MADAPGFYGKAVSRGDFLSRRLPSGFAAAWDGWLQTVMDTAQAALGEAWLASFMTMPVWHFTLGRGIAGPEPVLGVLIPSADRVGRYFPFTILGACAAGGLAAADWSGRVQAMALGALDIAFEPDALDAALGVLGPPGMPAEAPADGQSLWRSSGGVLRTDYLPRGSEAVWLVEGRT